jgi:Holliday junction DNA helicase RuvA
MDEAVEFFTMEYLENAGGSQPIPRLVGFGSEMERDFFELLIQVPGIGVRTALRTLKIYPSRFAQILARGEAGMLAELPGIGKKSAERIISELRGKMDQFLSEEAIRSRVGGALGEEEVTAVSVLIGLGLRRGEAEELVRKMKARGIKESDELVQVALKERGRKTTEVRR